MTSTPVLPAFPGDALGRLLPMAFEEDEGSGDITSLATIAENAKGVAVMTAKEAGVIAGLPSVERIFRFRGFAPRLVLLKREGEAIASGDDILSLEGPLHALLVCERIMLNVLQRLAGIATATREHVRALEGSRTRLLDTRKTLPGLRSAQKYAVRIGGGNNHRLGLYDAVMLKENHILAAGSIAAAAATARASYPQLPLIIEVESLDELQQALDTDCTRILIDDFSLADMGEAVRIAAGKIPLEVSGGVDLQRVREIALTGVDCISVGAITKHVHAIDFSMRLGDHA